MALALPRERSGDFGTSPFYGQRSETARGEPSGDAQEGLVKDILHGRVFEPALGHTGAHW
jgi:hypothetical protein